jgi:uncharacterized protein YjbI with pentapeptide repeats
MMTKLNLKRLGFVMGKSRTQKASVWFVDSLGNRAAIQAIDQLRVQGWLTDGSMQGFAMCRAPHQGANLEDANLCCAGFHQANSEWTNLIRAKLRTA